MLLAHQIFGGQVHVEVEDSPSGRILEQELSLYPVADRSVPPDLKILVGNFDLPQQGLVNPAIHHELDDGFAARLGAATVWWQWGRQSAPIAARLALTTTAKWRRPLQRMRSTQFASVEESIGQSFHELVMVPSVYFQPTRFLLHASALEHPEGGAIAIGGTGGVGKTSLAIELCLSHGFRFMADDITVVDAGGKVWPNLAYPKIYAYNLGGDPQLRRRVLQGRSGLDRLNWKLLRMRGAERVRRRVSPLRLYGGYSKLGAPLRRYIFIAREWRDAIEIEAVPAEQLAEMSVSIMRAEYEIFHRHLEWHKLNRRIQNLSPRIEAAAVFERWQEMATRVLRSVECRLLRVPRQMNHTRFRATVARLIQDDG